MPSLDIDPSLRIPAHEAERSQLLESIRSGSLLLVPSLNDPNATSPLEDMGFSSGLISTNELFQEELISVVNENAPESISQGYSGLF